MNGFSLLLAALSLGVDYGWQPTQDGQMEYIVQIEPVMLVAMREGQEVVSQFDPQMRTARRFRIHVGTEMVPRRGTAPRTLPTNGYTSATLPNLPGVQFGWQPIDRDQVEFIVQVAAERMTTLRTGEDIVGAIPIDLPNVARLKIISGTANLPRQGIQMVALGAPGAGQPQYGEGLPPASIAPPRTNDYASPYNTGAAAQPAGNSGAWASPTYGNNAWSANAASPAGSQPYGNPATGTAGWRTNQVSNTAASSTADPRYTGFAGIPPTQPLYDPSRYQNNNPAAGYATGGYATGNPQYRTDTANNAAGRWSQPTNPVPMSSLPPPPGTGVPNSAYYGGTEAAQGNAWTSAAPPTGNWSQRVGSETQPTVPNWSQPNSTWPQQRVAGQNEAARPGTPNATWPGWPQNRDPNQRYPRSDLELAKDRPWGALTVAVFLLFASVGGNLYLGWIALRIYRLYLDLADDLEDKERKEAVAEGDSAVDDLRHDRRRRRRAVLGV